MKSSLTLVSLALSAAGTTLASAAEPTPVPAVLAEQLAAERACGGLFQFCAKTRRLVAPAPDYPECPPHGVLGVDGATQTRTHSRQAAGSMACTVQYRS